MINLKEAEWRSETEAAGETAVRYRGSLVTGGEARQQFIRKWPREKDLERISRHQEEFDYAHWTFYVAIGALVAAIVGIIVTVIHL